MGIRWSAVAVGEAVDEIEKLLDPVYEHLWRAHRRAEDALSIPNLPQYMEQSLRGITSEIQHVTGSKQEGLYTGCLQRALDRARKDIPDGAVAAEKAATRHGKSGDLFA